MVFGLTRPELQPTSYRDKHTPAMWFRYKENWKDPNTVVHVCSLSQEFQDTKGVFRIRKSKKDNQHNGLKKKNKRTNNDLQNIHIKLKTGVELRCSGRVRSSCSTSCTRHVNLVTNSVISLKRLIILTEQKEQLNIEKIRKYKRNKKKK